MTPTTDTVKPPTKRTLLRYGLSLAKWMAMWDAQDGKCPICLRHMERPCVDHKHTKGWATFAAARRVLWVRSLVCWRCNRLVLGPERFGVTPEILRRAADYLERYAWKASAMDQERPEAIDPSQESARVPGQF